MRARLTDEELHDLSLAFATARYERLFTKTNRWGRTAVELANDITISIETEFMIDTYMAAYAKFSALSGQKL